MKRNPLPLILTIFFGVMLVASVFIYRKNNEFSHLGEVTKIVNSRSELYARLLVRYDRPPIYEEEYSMQDVNGVSTSRYRIRGYAGKEVRVTAPAARVREVSYFFGSLNQEGVWELINRPPVGNTGVHYTLYVKQILGDKQGERTVTFTDPQYWAAASVPGKHYEIHLDKNAPVDLSSVQSIDVDARYQAIVNEFRNFGSPAFRADVARAQAVIRSAK